MKSASFKLHHLLRWQLFCLLLLLSPSAPAQVCDPYSVGLETAKLTTPQWVGEPNVDAVVVLSIDDMRESAKYERFLRPILDRLKQIDGRAPVSIFTNSIDTNDVQLQAWLKEGLSLEVHTVDHPCPLLCDGDFEKAKSTYDRCIDMMCAIPNNQPVAFRMPCCDSLNTPSPRFWREIFEKQTKNSNYLAIDSSVFNIFTQDDPELSDQLIKNERGEPRFRHYLPFKSFVNTIENYPYPYIIGDACWEFPCVVPSDWEAQNVQQPNNPDTIRDLKRALDATVKKQGVMPIVFHPHGWIRNDQLVDFVNYADETYGKRVKFLNFAECLERLNQHLLGGVALRTSQGNEHNVRLVDLNRDGFLDVVTSPSLSLRESRAASPVRVKRSSTQPLPDESDVSAGTNATFAERKATMRIWQPSSNSFKQVTQTIDFQNPVFAKINEEVTVFVRGETANSNWQHFQWDNNEDRWQLIEHNTSLNKALRSSSFQARDIDADGTDELLISSESSTKVLAWKNSEYIEATYEAPVRVAGESGDNGVRLIDFNNDNHLDIVQSNGNEFGVWLFANPTVGWQKVRGGQATDADAIPTIANPDGTNNGAWFHSNHLWVQNEHTARLPDLVDRASFTQLVNKRPAKSANAEHPLGKAKSLDESLPTFDLIPGAKLTVVAAEPQVVDPIAFDWGPDGKLWVVEMSDYPNGGTWHGPGDPKNHPGGRVKILEDTDNDGRYETSHVFLDGLHYPTGVKAWRGGAIISGAPEIFYAEDTDGDFKADIKRVLYTGLREGNQQHRTNGLRWSTDLWLHMANGDSGGEVVATQTNNKAKISGRDYRIRPDDGLIETMAGQTQFGRTRDRWDNWFGGSNSHPIWQYVLEENAMRRNPHFSPPSARREIAEVPGAAPVYPTSETLERFNDFDRANKFTSACSPEIYRGDLVQHNAFYVCEPVHNLVHRSELIPNGPTFTSRRFDDEREREFLSSSDNWFRPVMVRTGPDGAIWVADMYRMVIEHPEWIPKAWQDRIDHLAGNDKGRIYRVVLPKHAQNNANRWKSIRAQDSKQLVQHLGNANGVVRDMAQQELYERLDAARVVNALLEYASTDEGKFNPAVAYLLHHASRFQSPRLRDVPVEAAPSFLRLLEEKLRSSADRGEELISFVDSQDWKAQYSPTFARLAMQCAISLGEVPEARTGNCLAKLALAHLTRPTDKYIRAAVMSSVNAENCGPLMDGFLKGLPSDANESEAAATNEFLGQLLQSAFRFRSKAALQSFVSNVDEDFATFDRYAEPFAKLLSQVKDQKIESYLADHLGWSATNRLQRFSARAVELVADASLDESKRLAYLKLFGKFKANEQQERKVLLSLLSPRQSQRIQREAITALMQGNASLSPFILERWSSFTPALRDYVLSTAMQRRSTDSEAKILDAITNKTILPMQVSIRHRQQLLSHKDESIRNRAKQIFAVVESNREKIVQQYRSHTTTDPDLARGKAVFGKQCSACHQLEGQGRAVGPDLTAISDKSLPAMFVAILDPNRAVEEKYLDYSVLTESGQLHRGILLEESATSITLATPEGESLAILRNEVEELKASGKSLMPEGLEQVLSAQDIADVTNYIQSISVPRKRFPGNDPQVAPVRDDGSIRLFAIHAEIYGPNVVLEEKYHNLGFWSDTNDRAVWTIDAPRAGKYEMILDYACPPQPSKNRYQIRVNGEVLGGEVEATSSWDNYRSKYVGHIRLPDEPVQLSIQSEGNIDGFLMDLRTILLYPDD